MMVWFKGIIIIMWLEMVAILIIILKLLVVVITILVVGIKPVMR